MKIIINDRMNRKKMHSFLLISLFLVGGCMNKLQDENPCRYDYLVNTRSYSEILPTEYGI
jgi:hypothetical protein